METVNDHLVVSGRFRSCHKNSWQIWCFRIINYHMQKSCNVALPKNISWPTGEKVQSVITKFSERNNFPVIIGALDDTHINIRAPDDHPQSYANGKQIHSLHLKAVCKWNSNIVMLAFLAAAMMPEFCANQTYRTVAWYFAMVIILLLMGHILCVDGC